MVTFFWFQNDPKLFNTTFIWRDIDVVIIVDQQLTLTYNYEKLAAQNPSSFNNRALPFTVKYAQQHTRFMFVEHKPGSFHSSSHERKIVTKTQV